jgi:RNA polymerase sigma factor (TIGR02999 family)
MPSPPAPPDAPVTQLLHALRHGSEAARAQVADLVYGELHRLAGRALRGERDGHTLQTTALVNEAYMRLVEADVPWDDRKHFYAVAARAMRRILVDHARAKRRGKRGGGEAPVTFDDDVAAAQRPGDLVALDDALKRLAEHDPRKAEAVELHYFGGLTYDELASALEISAATVHRELRLAKAWLYQHLEED